MLQKVIEMLEKGRNAGRNVFIEVTIPGQYDTEYIMNAYYSIENKIEYYKKTYDENGVHKNCKDIRMVDAGIVDQFTCVERLNGNAEHN